MTEPKFTKGPWEAEQYKHHWVVRTKYDCFNGEGNVGPQSICFDRGFNLSASLLSVLSLYTHRIKHSRKNHSPQVQNYQR